MGEASDGPAHESAQLLAAKAEVAALKAENAFLREELAALKKGAPAPSSAPAASMPPPSLCPPPDPPRWPSAPPYGYAQPPPYVAPPSHYGQPPPRPSASAACLSMNAENKRGCASAAPPPPRRRPIRVSPRARRPKGANIAMFCIPNSYTDSQVLELARPYGPVIFCQARAAPAGATPRPAHIATRRVAPCQVATHRDTGASRGYAFVSYEDVDSAQKAITALHSRHVDGRALRVELSRSDQAKPY